MIRQRLTSELSSTYYERSELFFFLSLSRYHENTGKRIELQLETEQEFFVPDPKGIAVEKFSDQDDKDEDGNEGGGQGEAAAATAAVTGPDETDIENVKKLLKVKETEGEKEKKKNNQNKNSNKTGGNGGKKPEPKICLLYTSPSPRDS